MATIKQRLTSKLIAEKVGKGLNFSVSKAMREAGYSKSYAHNPQRLMRSKSWPDVCEKELYDELLLKQHVSLLKAQKIKKLCFSEDIDKKGLKRLFKQAGCEFLSASERNGRFVIIIAEPNYLIWEKALDKAYKLKGKYNPQPIQFIRELEHLSDQELTQLIAEEEKKLIRK